MESIAIIGIGCRFPGAKNPASFWQLLRNGVDAISEMPKERWDIDRFYDPEPGKPGKISTRWGGFLEEVDRFDASFFGISPREVERTDPQQRLVLEVAWEALENAGIVASKLSGSQTGVFIGIGNYDYCRLLAQDLSHVNAYDGTGNTLSIAANRLSYIFNLRGPSVVVETACSSSLVALHFACRSLQNGESDLCLVGGVSLMLSPDPFITYSHARMMASDGRCKTFDASADGYVRGEGCGVIVLKRLEDALRDGDNIQAVVKGTAVNQDGLSNGLTAPNGPSQQAVIRQALKNAMVTPDKISYVETHGTGTSLGDPIEFKSLKAVLMEDRQPNQPCWLGSVKTNIGHLEAASGIASVIKVVLALQHREIPPHLHLKQLNPYISFEGTTFAIPTQCQPWLAGTESRLAGISAFGFGGTNCHAILEEAPGDSCIPRLLPGNEPKYLERFLHLLTLSAKSEEALRDLAVSYRDFLVTDSEACLGDICFSANTMRSHFDHRLAVVAESKEQLRQQLEAFAAGKETPGLISGQVTSKKFPKIAFLFTGQGSQYADMGRQLYETQPIFRQTLEQCDKILRSYLEIPLLEILYPDNQSFNRPLEEFRPKTGETPIPQELLEKSNAKSKIDETAYTQPALFALEYALFQLWKSWGIEPAAVMGHSVGEYVAACVAGVFSLEDGLKLIAERARLMQALPQDGEMVAVFANEAQVNAAIKPYAKEVSIAAINGVHSIVISGKREGVRDAIATLEAEGIKTKKLNVSHAFHSPLMEPMLADFHRVAAEISYSLPQIKLISNLTGEIATAEIATPEYWCRHVREAVKFAHSMETLFQQGYEVFLEIGPKPTLSGMGRGNFGLPISGSQLKDNSKSAQLLWLASLYPGREDWQQMLHSLATLYVRGVPVDWSGFDKHYPRRRLQLPTYPFQRQRYWAKLPENGHLKVDNNFKLLSQADTRQLIQQLETTAKLSEDELRLLPKLLDLLMEQNQQQQTAETIKDWLYQIQWQPKPRNLTNNEFDKRGSWLIFADRGGFGKTLAKVLQARGDNCILVYAGDTYQNQESGTWSIKPFSPADFERLFQDALANLAQPLLGIIHLWSLDAKSTDDLKIYTLEQAQILGVGSVLYLIHKLGKNISNSQFSPRLWLVTQGAVPVGSSLPNLAQAPLWGLAKVVALEYPELWGGTIDLDKEITEVEAANLLAEIVDSQGEDHLAFRDGQRYVARLVRKQLPESQKLTLQADGTYLITGGLGALGLTVAQWMVERGAKKLVLIGRRGASNRVQKTLSRMEELGAKILVAQADVANEADIRGVLDQIKISMPPLRGIVHAAGVPGYEAIADMTPDRLESVLRPKVIGSWILHQLTQEIKLDFFVSFSSISSVWGSKGQAHYAAANYFLDLLAYYRQKLGLPALSINWGPWAGGGMAVEEFQTWMSRMGIEALQPTQAIASLEYLLGTNCVQTTVANIDWSLFKGLYEARGKRSLLEQIAAQPQKTLAQQSNQRSEILQQLESAAISKRQNILITFLQNEVAKSLKLSQLPDSQQGLFDLGMDSIVAIELVNSIQSQLQVELPVADFLQASNIAALAMLLLKQFNPGNSTLEVTTHVLDLNEEAILDDSIYPETADTEPAQTAAILLTGATGFLGAFLLKELLNQTEADIYCLVRAEDAESGKIKIQKNLKDYSLWEEERSYRIIPVVGNLSQPKLGLSAEKFDKLARKIDVIYHNGAVLNFVYPYSALKPTNVLGTQEILRLACQFKVKPLHYVSTDAVFDSSGYYDKEVTESEPIIHTEGIDLGYTQTKWVAEKLVTIARTRGLPVSIYRPPLIAGDSRTGFWNTDDFTCRFLKGCIQMGSMPNMNCAITIVPVDYVSQAIVYLSQQKQSLGKAFHLNNPHYSSWNQVANWIDEFGYPVRQIAYEAWEAELIETLGSKDNALNGLLPFFLRRWSKEQLTFAELGQRRVKLNCQQTVASLAGTSIICPPVDSKLINTYFSHFIRSGFLESPKVGIGNR
ncbi:MAG TPA: short-chain dehydrogenase [Cyanobacteria bacterium UBA11369]|nr:short-chain dehydrogenase [Cyanobacteria bacterium UBA11371]HBE48829.1 short-chain dehydrogenase [Cyanobacteria bacterium UBA11369]